MWLRAEVILVVRFGDDNSILCDVQSRNCV